MKYAKNLIEKLCSTCALSPFLPGTSEIQISGTRDPSLVWTPLVEDRRAFCQMCGYSRNVFALNRGKIINKPSYRTERSFPTEFLGSVKVQFGGCLNFILALFVSKRQHFLIFFQRNIHKGKKPKLISATTYILYRHLLLHQST